jgi:hypothetical protein
MKSTSLKFVVVLALAMFTSGRPAAAPAAEGTATAFESIGPLTFGAAGGTDVLFAGDPQAATIYALDLAGAATGGTPGTKAIAAVDQKIAALVGATAADIAVTDLVVHPKTHNAFVSVMRGQGANATPVLVRIDGAGTLTIVNLAELKSTKVTLPNAPRLAMVAGRPTADRAQSITDMAFMDGKLYIAGLSNEEFASKLRSVPYPFAAVDNGTSVEIFHGSHGALETRSPVYTFVPYKINNVPNLIAGYLCTPLVRFPVSSLTPGSKVRGTTIAELGSGNRPIDMIVYTRGGQDYLLMSNTSRGVMKIPTASFAAATGINAKVESVTAGVPFETLADWKGVQHLDRVGADKVAVLAKADTGLSLRTIPLP